MSGFVYIWMDFKKKRFYIGSHWGSEDDGYICSSQWMKRSFKNRPRDFKRRILAKVESRELLYLEEERWLSMIKDHELATHNKTVEKRKNIRYYNVTKIVGKKWYTDAEQRKLVGQKVSASKKGKSVPCSPEKAAAISAAKKAAFARKREEFGASFPDGHKGPPKGYRKHTEQWKLDASERLKNQWATGVRT